MTIGPVVLRQQGLPFLGIACLVLTAFFIIQGLIVSGVMTLLSLAIAAIFALGALWYWFRARQSSVLIDESHVIIKEGRKQLTVDRGSIESVDLSSLVGQVRLDDGSALDLPLEGKPLIEAGVLLSEIPADV